MKSHRAERVEQLLEKGFSLLDQGRYAEALEVSAELEGQRHSAAFEIGALAHLGRGDLTDAIDVLKRGVEAAPTVWVLWQLLGNCESDQGRYSAAEDAYRQALDCRGVWKESVLLNRAILAARDGRFEESLDQLAGIDDPSLEIEVAKARINSLIGAGDPHRAAEEARLRLAELHSAGNQEEAGELGGLLARALLAADVGHDQIRAGALAALRECRGNEDALWVLRELDGEAAAGNSYLRILLHGRLRPELADLHGGALGYYSTVDVIAESLEDALRFVWPLEEDAASLLQVAESEVLEPRPNALKGVYAQNDRSFYLAD
ncbi:MAG: tetratricopeptide repeat protein [Gemmatimonadota bacterium]